LAHKLHEINKTRSQAQAVARIAAGTASQQTI